MIFFKKKKIEAKKKSLFDEYSQEEQADMFFIYIVTKALSHKGVWKIPEIRDGIKDIVKEMKANGEL